MMADLSLLSGSAEPKVSSKGKKYWTIVFSVEIHFGLTEFKARIKWMDNGTVKYGPAVIVYNERGSRLEDDDMDLYPEDDGPPNGGRYDRQRETSSRSRTPIEPPYGGSSSRRTSAAGTPEMPRMERTSSKGYSPSVAPSHRSGYSSRYDPPRSSDGDKGNDSDKLKGKERERSSAYGDRDRERSVGGHSGAVTPVERTRSSAYGGSTPVSRVPSSHGAQPDTLSSNWNANNGMSSRSPSVKQQSRSPSMYGNHQGDTASQKDFASTPKSPVEDRHSRSATPKSTAPVIADLPQSSHIERPPSAQPIDSAYDRPRSIVNPDNGLGYVADSAYDRPKSIFDSVHDRPTSVFAQESAFDRPKSPFIHEPQTAIGRSASPFVDRPKSVIENSLFGNDRPKSAFDDAPPALFGDQPAMFGDAGPAADIGHVDTKTPLFGESPSMFGEQPASAFDTSAADGWGFSATTPASTGSLTPGKKGKRKSAAATPVAPVSPAVSTKKSPLGQAVDMGATDITAAPATQGSPAAGAGLWGAQAPSPLHKGGKSSPLNPASHIPEQHNTNTFDWGGNSAQDTFSTGGGWNSGGATDSWGFTDTHQPENHETKIPSRVPSPVPPPVQATPVEAPPTPVDEVKETAASKKKKKKGGVAATVKADEDEKKKKEEAENREREENERKLREEQEKLEQELAALEAEENAVKAEQERQAEQARLKAEEDARLHAEEEERHKRDEEARREQEENEKREQEEKERVEKEKREQELKEKEKEEAEKKATESSSLFGNTTSLFGATGEGGGDDSWNTGGSLGWGAPVATTGKKKKGKNANTNPLTSSFTQPSAFGSSPSAFGFGSAGTGWGLGATLGEDLGNNAASVSPKPSPKVTSTELPASTDIGFSFDSKAADLDFSFGNKPASKVPSRAASPAPEPVAETAPAAEPTEEPPADNAADDLAALLEGNGAGEEDEGGFGAPVGGKKKKKKGKAGAADDTPAAAPIVETPVVETPVVEAPAEAAGGGGAKKKKKKK
ncbi:hypothetical protein D9619_004494 [Psilocybe cf. subviscida]|uniref:Uncharacterized protein n=1 Tax=Psilocybe cf. subviscida TaxID=2480587 RepID=A0A8H5BNM1_9AGAR|nr:hypothetical protein D9619_004494 [Psilocybe cf. subviscida]